MSETAISVRGLSKRYGAGPGAVQALCGVRLDVRGGRITGLLGPNGAGKSTLIHTLLGLVLPDAGRCEIFGRPAADPRSRRGVGFLPEEVTYEAALKSGEILALHARLAGAGRTGTDEAPAWLGDLGIEPSRRISDCSMGTARRLALACALIGRPRLLILDEPTSGMDLASRDRLLDYLIGFRLAGGTALIASHLLAELEAICDTFVVLHRGRVTRVADASELRDDGRLRITFEGLAVAELRNRLGPGWRVFHDGSRWLAERERTAAGLAAVVSLIERHGGRVAALERGSTLEQLYREEIEP